MSNRDAAAAAEAVRQACLAAALAAYEDAGIRGLCAEGRWELAVDAIRALDLSPILQTPTIQISNLKSEI